MIHHISIAARDPKHVASIFSHLFDGVCIPFPPNPGAYLAIAKDAHGTAVEVYPADCLLKPNGAKGADFVHSGTDSGFGPVHFALSVDCGLAQIEAIAKREGWECHVCSRGGDFDVAELWIENTFMVELLPPDFAARYLAFASLFAEAESPAALMASHQRLVPA